MPGNTFGQLLRLTSFGESHGKALGGVLDGFPPGIEVDYGFIQHELDRRKPGQSDIVSSRNEADEIEVLSGVFNGKTTGAPIGFIFRNTDKRSSDYDPLANVYRPSHAGFVYEKKYGIDDHRGGGRASARETVVRVAGGAFAKLLLKRSGIDIAAFTIRIGEIKMESPPALITRALIDASPVKCPHSQISEKMTALLKQLKQEGDSTGGVIECRINGCPAGLGEPVFDKLSADLAKAMMGISAAKGIEIGSGFGAAAMKGSEHNDPFIASGGKVRTATNHSGGIQGGISNGETIVFRVAFKPASSIGKKQNTIDKAGRPAEITIEGRHDPCVVPRAAAVVEAMAALTVSDHLLRNNSTAYLLDSYK
jgi:chorismate synthase